MFNKLKITSQQSILNQRTTFKTTKGDKMPNYEARYKIKIFNHIPDSWADEGTPPDGCETIRTGAIFQIPITPEERYRFAAVNDQEALKEAEKSKLTISKKYRHYTETQINLEELIEIRPVLL